VGALGLGRIEDTAERSRITRKLVWWLILVAALALGNYAVRFSGGKAPKDVLYHWDNAVGGAVQFLVILGLALAIARDRPGLLALRRPRSWRGAAGGAFAILIGVYVLSAILGPILHPGREQGLTPDHWDSARAAPFVANAIIVCVLAPFVEECTFRGVGYGLLAERFGAEPALVGSALCFGLAHGLVEALPLLVAFGIGLAWLRERQNSTIPGMILHGTFNAVALAASILA
jgi:membrane protease YdiL (CAAX protease family)